MNRHPTQPLGPAETTKPMRVALVSETFPPEVNGVAHTVARFALGLRERGHRVQVVRPRQRGHTPDPREGGLLVRGLPLPGYPGLQLGLPAGPTLTRSWQKERPDVLYVATEGPLGWSAVRTADRLGIPCISGFHTRFDSYSRHYGAGLLRGPIERYLRALHRRTVCTVVPTDELRLSLEAEQFGDLRVLGRGVDTERFHPMHRREALRRAWGVAENEIVVLAVGRLAAEKNLPLALRSADTMREANRRVRLVVVGDGPLYSELFHRQRDVVFCGAKTGRELAEHYASADVLLFPSETETFGNVVLEAMASGLAVVAYDYAAAHALIEPEVDGLLVPFGDEEAFVTAALRLAVDPAFGRRLGQRARDKARRHEWPHVIDQLESLLYCAMRGDCPDDDHR
jgi:glycosyltransferase involved in cell wall biosynthesis